MKFLFDTSALIAGSVEGHPAHGLVYPWLSRILHGHDSGLISAHSLAELYAKLTRIPFAGGTLRTEEVQRILDKNIRNNFEIIALSDADQIITLNPKHFRSIYPSLADRIVDPNAESQL